jgi:HEAT repeat protein
MTDPKYGSATQIMALPATRLAALVSDPNATVFAKAKACQRLAITGDGNAVPAVAKLLGDQTLSHYARTALEQIPHASASDALRAALAQVKGGLLVGVINSLGVRRDTKAIADLSRLRQDSDPQVARAADAALARIRPGL